MEKLLYKENRIMCCSIDKIINVAVYQTVNRISGWVFLGMEFSKNINGQILCNPSIALTFLSNICMIPDRLLPSSACFRLYRQGKGSAKYPTMKKECKKIDHFLKIHYFCKPKIGLKKSVNLYQDLTQKCKLFLGRVKSLHNLY